jgi:peptidoglycan/xylan/chitin deacetylase (PgdA/CDA1 family)
MAGRVVFVALWLGGAGLLAAMAAGLLPGSALGAGAVVLGLCISVAMGVLSQRCGFFAAPLNRVPGTSGHVSLTFDDGPDRTFTPQVLDLLAAAGQRATFFVVGERVARHPELARRILAEGHELGNHSLAHRWDMALWPAARVAADQEEAARVIHEVAGVRPRLFRPPAAALSPRIARGTSLAGNVLVGFSTRSGDGSAAVPARVALARLTRGLKAGAILVLHDAAGGGRTPAVCEVLPELIRRMEARGLRSVPVSELVEVGETGEAGGPRGSGAAPQKNGP